MIPPDDEQIAAAARTGTSVSLWAQVAPDEPAVISAAGVQTFAELDAAANRLARALRARGLAAGDAVAVALTNRPEFAEVVQACLRAGLRYTPVNWHLTPDEIAYVVTDCEARALIGDALIGDVLADVARRCDALVATIAIGGPIDGFEDLDPALAAHDGAALPDPVLGNRMLYTSGTTGRPKGVVRPPGYSTGLAAITDAPRYRAGTGQRHLITGPLYHGGPLGLSLAMSHAHGVGVVLMERWDAATALALIEEHAITHTHMVPTMFHRLLRLPAEVRDAADVSSLQYVLHGAAPCPVPTKQAMIDWFGPVLWEYFAATEGAGASCSSAEWLAHPGTVGIPPKPGHVRIVDEHGDDCPPGVPGAICIRRDETAFEYFNDPDKTARTRRGDHFSIGDIGYLDDEGYLYVTDRDAELIISGGVNIYPAEIEAVLLAHPSVRDAAVIGVANEEWGEEVRAIVELEDGITLDGALTEALLAHCRSQLAGFKCPRHVEATERLPRLDNGKLYRNELRAQHRRQSGAVGMQEQP